MSAPESERLARCALNHAVEPGDDRLAAPLRTHGAAATLAMLARERDLGEVRTDTAARLARTDPARELERAAARGMRFVVPGDPEWPCQLDDLDRAAGLGERTAAPLGLWVRGPLRLTEVLTGAVAVVGSRSATSYGTDTARETAAGLARAGHTVVSGAAFGIDQAAHRGALAGRGPTLAVLACGADRVYPADHQELLAHLAEHGAIVSEAPPGSDPKRHRFLVRNRLIAALTCGTVVVEAADRSGALSTAGWAERLCRLVMGVPGPVTSVSSAGVHHLIRTGAATLVTGAADVLELVGTPGDHLLLEPRTPPRARDHLTGREQRVLDAVPAGAGAGTDAVAHGAGIGPGEAGQLLDRLVSQGLVTGDAGGWRLTERAQRNPPATPPADLS